MKRIITIALCALFSLTAGARTLYVDAKRPNNNGNGLKAATAKKTIQAAINIAKKGDTIVVMPGTYAPITTKNKKIKIKARSGNSSTIISSTPSTKFETAIAKLGKEWKQTNTYYDSYGKPYTITKMSGGETKGTATSLAGFSISSPTGYSVQAGVSGGTITSCVIENVDSDKTVCRSKLTACTIQNCTYFGMDQATLTRCTIRNNSSFSWQASKSCNLANCLIVCNENLILNSSTLANCTVADNTKFAMSKTKAYNTIFYKVAASQFKAKKKNKLTKCYKGSAPKFVSAKTTKTEKVEVDYYDYWDEEIWDGTQYRYYSTKTVDVPANYHLAKGSPCIDKGTKAKAAKKLFGSKDLDGKKRIKGKSVDIGCYEY